jgi:hypothetical protein
MPLFLNEGAEMTWRMMWPGGTKKGTQCGVCTDDPAKTTDDFLRDGCDQKKVRSSGNVCSLDDQRSLQNVSLMPAVVPGDDIRKGTSIVRWVETTKLVGAEYRCRLRSQEL